jgi:hypothetical protein
VKGQGRYLWLAIGLLYIFGCATPAEQPATSVPHAVLEFPAAIRLLALDDQTVDARIQPRRLQVRPGQHVLRLAYVAMGPGSSPAHDGQHAAPFVVEAREGFAYRFEAKT